MRNWKVSYQCIEDRDARRPFWKRTTIVQAESRLDAIGKIQAKFGPPRYGNYRASPTDKAADRVNFS